MSDSFRDKLGGYLNDELEELKFLRSVSPYAYSIGSRSPRRQSRSPKPNKSDPSPSHAASSACQETKLCSAPDIAAWPIPNTTNPKPTVSKPACMKPPTIITSSSSLSPCMAVAAARSPYTSPQPSPVPTDTSHFSDESSKLLTMLKVVAASSPGSGGHVRHESELRQKIQTLEETVAEYEKQKYSVMGTFKDYGERVAERERKLEAEYSNKIIALSEEVLGAKKDFETRMKSFQALQEQFEREKEQALEKLRQEHQKEIQVLEQRFSQSQLLNLEQKYIIEIQRLEEERKSLRTEKERLGETFERKLRRAQSLYETELTAAKLLYTKELEALRDHEEALKDELAARQDEFHDRLQEIQHQAKHSKDEMNNCKNEVALLERKLRKKELEVQNISREMSTAKNETNEALKKLTEAKSDLEGIRRDYNDQKAEFDKKLKMLTVAEATRKKLESTIRELQIEVKALRNKVDFLEMERDNLQSQSESQTQLHNSQVQALEAVLDSVTKEKETTKEHYERLLEREREQAEEREYSIKKEFSTKLNELEDQYNALREHIEQSDSFGPENVKLWEEIECLRSEKSILEDEVTGLRTQLTYNQQSIDVETAVHLQQKPIQQPGTENELSLDYIIELLRAIDVVKKKVLQSGTNSRASETPEDRGLSFVKEADCSELAVDVDEDQSKEDSRIGGQQVLDIFALIKQLKGLECSVSEIIIEKNEAKCKVEQLGEENRVLMEKLEYFKNFATSEAFSQHGEGSSHVTVGLVDEYKARVSELENRLRSTEEAHERMLEEQREMLQEIFAKDLLDQKKNMESKMAQLKEKFLSANSEDEIKNRMLEMEQEQKQLRAELESKTEQIKEKNCQAEDFLKNQEQLMLVEMQQKICDLNNEHEKFVECMRQRESQLNKELKEKTRILAQNQAKTEMQEDQTQTENCCKEDLAERRERQNIDLDTQLLHLKMENNQKDEFIQRLQEELSRQEQLCRKRAEETNQQEEKKQALLQDKARKDRSQSLVANSEHAAMCQKAATRFHNLVNQITEKREKNYKTNEAARSKQCNREKLTVRESSRISPKCLSPLREKSPFKISAEDQETLNSIAEAATHRSLLSPLDVGCEDSNRRSSRVSPSRFFFGKTAYDKSEKRPAWKF